MKIFLEVDGMLTEVVTVMTAAYHLKYHHRTIQRWCDEGRLIAWNVESRWYIEKAQIESIAKALDYNHKVMAS